MGKFCNILNFKTKFSRFNNNVLLILNRISSFEYPFKFFRNIARPVEGNRRTNNVAEIQAAIAAANMAVANGIFELRIHMDSQFVINSMMQWIPKWKRNGWRTASGEPVQNKVDFLQLDAALRQLNRYEFVSQFLFIFRLRSLNTQLNYHFRYIYKFSTVSASI